MDISQLWLLVFRQWKVKLSKFRLLCSDVVFTVRPSPSSWPERTAAAGFVTAVKSWWVWMLIINSSALCVCVSACRMTWEQAMCLLNISEGMWITTCESQTINHVRINDRAQEEFHNFPLSLASQGELLWGLFKTLKLCGISAFSVSLVFIIVNMLWLSCYALFNSVLLSLLCFVGR